jgi:hypothetical protein
MQMGRTRLRSARGSRGRRWRWRWIARRCPHRPRMGRAPQPAIRRGQRGRGRPRILGPSRPRPTGRRARRPSTAMWKNFGCPPRRRDAGALSLVFQHIIHPSPHHLHLLLLSCTPTNICCPSTPCAPPRYSSAWPRPECYCCTLYWLYRLLSDRLLLHCLLVLFVSGVIGTDRDHQQAPCKRRRDVSPWEPRGPRSLNELLVRVALFWGKSHGYSRILLRQKMFHIHMS